MRMAILLSWEGWAVQHPPRAGVVHAVLLEVCRNHCPGSTHRWEMAPAAWTWHLLRSLRSVGNAATSLPAVDCTAFPLVKWQSNEKARTRTWLLWLNCSLRCCKLQMCLLFCSITLGKRKSRSEENDDKVDSFEGSWGISSHVYSLVSFVCKISVHNPAFLHSLLLRRKRGVVCFFFFFCCLIAVKSLLGTGLHGRWVSICPGVKKLQNGLGGKSP